MKNTFKDIRIYYEHSICKSMLFSQNISEKASADGLHSKQIIIFKETMLAFLLP